MSGVVVRHDEEDVGLGGGLQAKGKDQPYEEVRIGFMKGKFRRLSGGGKKIKRSVRG